MRLLVALLFLCVSCDLFGQSRDSVYNEILIDEVVVSGSLARREVIPVQRLSGAELEGLAAHSVADAVRYFSGAQIKDYGGVGGLKTVNVRSMGSHHVGVFYDGVEVSNAQNGVVDLGRFSLDNMAAIELYNGQKSSIFQAAKDFASASAIYMSTRRPSFGAAKGYNLNVGLKGGSFETINPSLLWEQRISERVRASLSGEYLYSSGEYPFSYSKEGGYDTTEVRKNGDIRYLRAEAALFGDMDNGQWQAKAYFYDSERGYPGAAVREEPGVFVNADRQWDRSFFVQGVVNKSFSSWYNLKINAKFASDELRYLSDPTTQLPVDNSYDQQEYYASVANLFSVASWASVSLSSDLQYNDLDADVANFAFPERLVSYTSLATSVGGERLKFQGSVLYTYVGDRAANGGGAAPICAWTPTAVLSYEPFGEWLNLRAFYKKNMRMPTLNDLYYTTIGSVSLDPERSEQYNVGATYRFEPRGGVVESVKLGADLYYNEIDDKIIATPTSNQFRWTMVNLGYVEIRGVDVEAEAQWSLGGVGLSTALKYSFQQAEDYTDRVDKDYGGQIPYTPWHSGSAVVGADFEGWQLNYSFIYTGERYDSVANIAENYIQPWYTSDLSLSRSFAVAGCELRATLSLNNIFDQSYEVVRWYPMPGRNYNIKINVLL